MKFDQLMGHLNDLANETLDGVKSPITIEHRIGAPEPMLLYGVGIRTKLSELPQGQLFVVDGAGGVFVLLCPNFEDDKDCFCIKVAGKELGLGLLPSKSMVVPVAMGKVVISTEPPPDEEDDSE